MKFYFISMAYTYDDIISQMETDGHTVKQLTNLDFMELYCGRDYLTEWIENDIAAFSPDYVINNIPSIRLSASSDYTYLGNTIDSSNLDLEKWNSRSKAGELGWNLAEVLEECTMDSVSTSYTDTVFLKPKYWDDTHVSWKIPAGSDIAAHNLNFLSFDAFVEKDIGLDREFVCDFIMADGSYHIYGIEAFDDFSESKVYGNYAKNWKDNTVKVSWTQAEEDAFKALCVKWLDFAATKGGNYEGDITGAIKNDEFYWFEQNCKKGPRGTFTGDYQDWLDTLKGDLTKASNYTWEYFS